MNEAALIFLGRGYSRDIKNDSATRIPRLERSEGPSHVRALHEGLVGFAGTFELLAATFCRRVPSLAEAIEGNQSQQKKRDAFASRFAATQYRS